MDVLKQARDELGRVKVYYLRNETTRALYHAVLGVKAISGLSALPMEMRGLVRDAVQHLARDENLKPHIKAPIAYTPGQERQLLLVLADLYKRYMAALDYEDHDTALARKLKLDHAFNLGKRLLDQKQSTEADACFAEAVTCYKDEHSLFKLIGRVLVDAGEVRRAVPYLRRAVELEPDNAEVGDLLRQATAHK